MYRNYLRGTDQTFPESGSGGSSSSTGTTTTSTQPQQKFSVAGSSSHFVPSLNAVTSSQELQWMVEPSIMGPPGPSRSLRPQYPIPSGAPGGAMGGPRHFQGHQVFRPGVIRAPTGSGSGGHSTRRRADDHLSPEEQERRRIRRERNKMAAAKCRNRRRELTDTLQSETDLLEDEKSRLQKEIANLQKEKDKLELVLEAHRPICKAQDSDSDSDSDSHPTHSISHSQRHHHQRPTLGGIKIEPDDSDLPRPSTSASASKAKVDKPRPKITIPPPPSSLALTSTTIGSSASTSSSTMLMESETLNTPVLLSTPSLTPFTASLVFTYPTAALDVTGGHSEGSAQNLTVGSGSSSSSSSAHPLGSGQAVRRHQTPCGIAHRRSSSSGDQSDHSLHSPTILTL
ncbi:fos-related antigen 1a [Engraulis encrasicolus]|uniref:fos-related antigen 1a n=1 Tax=Engraulis encrasicolus TaxID=184585 RepID=UPI002FD23E25